MGSSQSELIAFLSHSSSYHTNCIRFPDPAPASRAIARVNRTVQSRLRIVSITCLGAMRSA